jgi:serine/threonine protein kinase
MRSTVNRVGKYELRSVLARTALSTVYDGWDSDISRRVAIKMMPLSESNGEEANEALARFKRGAQAAGQLNHPSIVAVYDYGETAEYAYLVMEFIDGPTLKGMFDSNQRFGLNEVCRMMGSILEALQYSHDRGIVHRDVKPANIMFTKDNRVKITDFGIARLEDSEMTQAGMVIGTPAYMSPEQFLGEKVDWRTDIYSTGVVLYQILTGERPYEGTLATIMHKVLYGSPPLASRLSAISTPALDQIVSKSMARDPEDRFETAAEFGAALQALLSPNDPGIRQGSPLGSPRSSPPPANGPRDGVRAVPPVPPPARPGRPAVSANSARPVVSRAPGVSPRVLILAAVGIFVLAAGGAWAWFSHGRTSTSVALNVPREVPRPETARAPEPVEPADPQPDASAPDTKYSAINPSPQTSPPDTAISPPPVYAPEPVPRAPEINQRTVEPLSVPPLPPPVEPPKRLAPEVKPPPAKKQVAGVEPPKNAATSNVPPAKKPPGDARGGRGQADEAEALDPNALRRNAPADYASAGTLRRPRDDPGNAPTPPPDAPPPAPTPIAATSSSSVGLLCRSVTAETAQRLGLDSPRGMLVTGVTVGSTAAKAGFRQDDVILAIQGSEARSLSVLNSVAMSMAPGQTVPVEIFRHGSRQVVQLPVDQLRR